MGRSDEYQLDFREDRTQWATSEVQIGVAWTLTLSSSDDPALIAYIKELSDAECQFTEVDVVVGLEVEANTKRITVSVDGSALPEGASLEFVTRLRKSNSLFLHNSAEEQNPYIYAGPGRRRSYYEVLLSEDEQKKLSDAAKAVQKSLRRLVKGHKEVLGGLLGKLNEKYDVEFTTFENLGIQEMPLGISLKDKRVKVPISDWGSGTQNRTYILMSLLQAKRIKELEGSGEKITPNCRRRRARKLFAPRGASGIWRTLAGTCIRTWYSNYCLHSQSIHAK